MYIYMYIYIYIYVYIKIYITTNATCRELLPADIQQPDSNWEPLVSERKLPATKERARLSI